MIAVDQHTGIRECRNCGAVWKGDDAHSELECVTFRRAAQVAIDLLGATRL